MANFTKNKQIELAHQEAHGEWTLVGDFADIEAAKKAAHEYAASGLEHRDDSGNVVFGMSDDLGSGHYEERYEVFETGEGAFTR